MTADTHTHTTARRTPGTYFLRVTYSKDMNDTSLCVCRQACYLPFLSAMQQTHPFIPQPGRKNTQVNLELDQCILRRPLINHWIIQWPLWCNYWSVSDPISHGPLFPDIQNDRFDTRVPKKIHFIYYILPLLKMTTLCLCNIVIVT